MSFFYGKMKGARAEKTCTGHRNTGLSTTAMSYSGDIKTRMWYDSEENKIIYDIKLYHHDTDREIKHIASGTLNPPA